MYDVFIGIDPGLTGAMAIISQEAVQVFDFSDPIGLIKLRELSASAAMGLIEPIALLERVNAMPKQGVTSMFKFGSSYGQWLGRCESFGIPLDHVLPRIWQKDLHGPMQKIFKMRKKRKVIDTKAMSLNRARQMFPGAAEAYLTRVKDHNRAEALLIAEFCRRKHGGGNYNAS